MALLNARNNQFAFRFPKGFLYPAVAEKYNFYLKKMNTPFHDISSYLNHTIQSLTFPSMRSDETMQFLDKQPQFWRESLDFQRIIQKEFTVNFKTVDGYLNYWILVEQYAAFLKLENMDDYHPDMSIYFLDRDGYQLVTVTFKQPLMKGVDSVDMSYASSMFEFKTFGITFKYNDIAIDVKID